MPDNLNRREPEDPTRINLGQPWEVQYWTDKLGVTEARLRAAVAAAGVSVAAVRAWLRSH